MPQEFGARVVPAMMKQEVPRVIPAMMKQNVAATERVQTKRMSPTASQAFCESERTRGVRKARSHEGSRSDGVAADGYASSSFSYNNDAD